MMRGAFADVPLTVLFPFLTSADVDSLRQTASTVDAARAARPTADWEWRVGHAASPGTQSGTPIVLGLDVIEAAAGGDQLEFLLQVVMTDSGRLAVDAAVNVACWCETEHATHDVDALRLAVGGEMSLPDAFRVGAERLTGWLDEPYDADHWRSGAGLPARWIN
ncbi:hypothetical protein ACFCZV_00580 [Streptomyces hydrogenans]|uniref:hypothetical protein n=1 Tax=Streptomyces hydrogenans TaxID=1873719 RepID=UPI0035D7D399